MNENINQQVVYNGNHKHHALSYQAITLPCGICLFHGPYAGTMHDAHILGLSGVLAELGDILDATNIFYKLYGDVAYPTHQHLVHAYANIGPLAPNIAARRRHNDLMARFRIVVEQIFAELDNNFAGLTFKNSQKLGSCAVGQTFMLAAWLLNIRSFFYGNMVSAMEGNQMLLELSLREYLSVSQGNNM